MMTSQQHQSRRHASLWWIGNVAAATALIFLLPTFDRLAAAFPFLLPAAMALMFLRMMIVTTKRLRSLGVTRETTLMQLMAIEARGRPRRLLILVAMLLSLIAGKIIRSTLL